MGYNGSKLIYYDESILTDSNIHTKKIKRYCNLWNSWKSNLYTGDEFNKNTQMNAKAFKRIAVS